MKAKSKQSSKKAVTRQGNSGRPQNRHLRPFKKGEARIPKSRGRPPTRYLLQEIGNYIAEHPDDVTDYFRQPVYGKKRLHRLIDLLVERHTVQFCHMMFGKPR